MRPSFNMLPRLSWINYITAVLYSYASSHQKKVLWLTERKSLFSFLGAISLTGFHCASYLLGWNARAWWNFSIVFILHYHFILCTKIDATWAALSGLFFKRFFTRVSAPKEHSMAIRTVPVHGTVQVPWWIFSPNGCTRRPERWQGIPIPPTKDRQRNSNKE